MGNDSQCLDHPQPKRPWRHVHSRLAESAGWAVKAGGRGWPGALRLPLGHAILAMLTGIGLLMAFHQVVLGAVQQGELRRKATAMQAEAESRCNALNGARSREICLMQLNAMPPLRAGVTVANVASAGH
jgi:hypothetical protein